MSQPELLPSGRRGRGGRKDGRTFFERRRARRAAKKRRIRAMSVQRRIARRVGILATWLLAFLAVVVVAGVSLFYSLSNVPSPASLPLPQVATIEYSDGSTLASIGSVNRITVSIDQVPAQVRWDILAAEDRNFYDEPGVSITGTLRAAVNDLTGGDTQGGSGITQQYVKNAYLSNSRTLSRKLKELAIAVKLSREYSKDKILEYYLNTVYFGRGTYGIQSAAHAYFGTDVSKLNTAQGAVLAALLRAPSYYDPAANPSAAKARWQYVIDGMVDTGHLTKAQAAAMTYPKVLPSSNNSGLTVTGPKALIVQRVIAELEANGVSEDEIYARGLTIRTTINRRAQNDAQAAISKTFGSLTKAQRNMKNALVAVAPKTGAVLAYYGGPYGRNYAGRKDLYDYASLGFAAPGSSFKPYTLATALTQTLTSTSNGRPIAIDTYVNGSQCVMIEGTKICNDPSDKPFSSPHIRVEDAMKYSLNTTFDQMADKVGPDEVAKTARAAGISKQIDGRTSLTDAHGQTTFGIGIGDYPVHPIDQAVGFATFANDGVANPSYFVTSATASDGEVVYRHKATPTRAVDAKVANDVTMSLERVAGFSDVPLADGRESAAKTGTEGIQSGKHAGGNSDAWMVGFTPQVSVAVWVGSGNSTSPIVNSSGAPEYGRDLPGRTWQLFMNSWLANKPQRQLPDQQQIHAPTNAPTTVRPSSSMPAPATDSSSPSMPDSPSAPTSPSSPTSPPTTPPNSPTPPTSPAPSCSPGIVLPNCTSASTSGAPPR